MPFLLIIAFTLSAVGLYLAMPGGRRNAGQVALIALAGAAALFATALLRWAGDDSRMAWFVAMSVIGLWGAVRVVTHSKPVYSALYFVLVAVAVSGLVLLAQAEFLAVSLLVIYAGAILVTYVFVIMLAQRSGPPPRWDLDAREPFLGVVSGFLLLAVIAWRAFSTEITVGADLPPMPSDSGDYVASVGVPLLTRYAVAIQLAGLLLLGSMVGAIAIARRKPSEPDPGEQL